MTKQVQRRRGSSTQHTGFTGADGEISVNTTNKSVHVHDGATAGGFEAARADLDNVDSTANLSINNLTVSGTVDGRDVAADGTKLDGIEASADVTDATNVAAAGALMTTGGSVTGDVLFGDSDAAIFGAGSDLQIYHDGSASNIRENGTGNLQIWGDDIHFYNSAGSENIATFITNGAVKLFYDNAQKLATTASGCDITGGLNTTGNVDISGSSGATLKLTSTDTTGADTELLGQIDFVSSDVSGGSAGTQARIKGVYEDNGDSSGIAFLTGASTGSGSPTINEVMRIRHEGNVGIGTNVPSNTLSVEGSGTGLSINSTNDEVKKIAFENSGTTTGYIGSSSSTPLRFFNGSATEYMRIDSSGAVVINNSGGDAQLYLGGATGTSRMYLARSGLDSLLYNVSNGNLRFGTNNTERMRILSSGGITFNGDTAAANALDDYEEGTWTPALNGGLTPTVTQASYTLIGNRVFLNCQITVPSNSTNSSIIVSGLPYTTTENGAGSLAYTTVSTVNSMGILMQGTQIFFYKGNAYSNYLLSDFSGHTLIFTAQYNIA